jgi:hypothetical protein
MTPFVAVELAVIAALTTVIRDEERPDALVLAKAFKEAHQGALGQVSALCRLAGEVPVGRDRALLAGLDPLLARVTAPLVIAALRDAEAHVTALYAGLPAGEGVRADAIARLADHGHERVAILDVHLAHAGLRTCERCLLDRPGARPALSRENPAIYVCAGCHDDTLAAFPPDLPVAQWPDALREDRVLEKAASKPSKLAAKRTVHPPLVGRVPVAPPPDRAFVPGVPPIPATPARPPTTRELALAAAGPSEQAYSAALFDPARVRERW